MHKVGTTLCVILVVLIATFSTSVSGRPTDKLIRHKRQSDQRLAELETLLALQKYRHHRLRPEHKGSQPGYGVIDFNTIGRRKKSTRFSPGERSLDHDIREDAFNQAAKNLSDDLESPVPDVADPALNEKIDNLLSIKSLLDQQSQEKVNIEEAPQGLDDFAEKK